MKLLDIMKRYDRCLVRESAKLTKIYNMLLKESADEADDDADLSEEACEICGNDPCTCDANEAEETDDLDECGLIPEDDFIKKDGVKENDMLRNRPHNGHIDDPAGIMSEEDFFACESEETDEDEDEDDEDDETVSAEEFFSEAEKCDGDDCDEAEEMMSAAEFFGSADKPKTTNEAEDDNETKTDESEKADKSKKTEDESEKTDESEDSEKTNESEDIDEETEIEPNERMISAREFLPETEEKKLEESLKSYRRKNHRLFNG